VGRVVELQLRDDRAGQALGESVELDQRGAADQVGDVVVDGNPVGSFLVSFVGRRAYAEVRILYRQVRLSGIGGYLPAPPGPRHPLGGPPERMLRMGPDLRWTGTPCEWAAALATVIGVTPVRHMPPGSVRPMERARGIREGAGTDAAGVFARGCP